MESLEHHSASVAERQANHRILVADDDFDVLDFYKLALNASSSISSEFADLFLNEEDILPVSSYQLSTVTSGEDAIFSIQQAIDEEHPYAAIFLDIDTNKRPNGLETAMRIREIDPNIHIIIVSTYNESAPSELRTSVFSHLYFLRKPLDLAEVEHMAYNACMNWNRNQQLQQELSNNQRYQTWLTQLFDALPMPATVIDVENYDVVLHSGHEPRTNKCFQLLHNIDHPCAEEHGGCPLQQVLATGQRVMLEQVKQLGDEKAIIELHAVPIRNQDGNIHQILEFSVDVTARQRRLLENEALVRQQRELFNTFRSTAHTMKNSIGYLNGVVERVMGTEGSPQVLADFLNHERMQLVQEQVSVIHTMLQLALGNAKESARIQRQLPLHKKIEEGLSLFGITSLGKGKVVETDFDISDSCCIMMSAIDFQTMLLNLLNNAADAIDLYLRKMIADAGMDEIQKVMEIQEEPMLFLKVAEEDGVAWIEIRNRGDAIPEEKLETIFEQGVSMKQHGNGVGLYDVRQILKQANGTISARNGEDEVTFTVTIPATTCTTEENSNRNE